MEKIPVGVLGATGMVGERYVSLLENHPWFRTAYVAASPRSAGKSYEDAAAGRWLMGADIPAEAARLTVGDANDAGAAAGKCAFVFSALEMDKDETRRLEETYAAAGIPVISNASAHRWTPDVPVLIPEINPEHTAVIPLQQKNRGWARGFIAVKPNCSLQSYAAPVHALIKAGFPVSRMIVATMQAVSGAGFPGPSSFTMIDNVIPFIAGEEEKTETEILKILGTVSGGGIANADAPLVSAHCNRVAVTDGHTACVSLEFALPAGKKPPLEEVAAVWEAYRGEPQALGLPSAPERPIIVRREADRPQPARDRDAEKGMAVTVGRLRPCRVFDIRFTALSHNTRRGAALGGILNAELLKAKGFLG